MCFVCAWVCIAFCEYGLVCAFRCFSVCGVLFVFCTSTKNSMPCENLASKNWALKCHSVS